ncbi:MAG TPA: FAD-dependent oxidoreductase, partial [Arthrobacter sp.]|nr:FAD-dependent oxidoreductase [Arthrobacter sp.]
MSRRHHRDGVSGERSISDSAGHNGGPRRQVVIIGAGVAGLASAALLSRAGHHVTVVEKNAADGGRAGSWESGGFRFDTGPSWYLMPEV